MSWKTVNSSRLILLSYLLFISACQPSQPSAASAADIQIRETSSRTNITAETIRINNCGGKADSKQTAERSLAVIVDGSFGASAGYSIIQANISAKYGQSRSVSKKQELTAPPGTNMEFVLKWTEQEWAGTVLASGQTGTYNARAPITVEQISSADLGCGIGTLPTTSVPPAVAPINPPSQTAPQTGDCTSLVSSSRPVSPMGTGDNCWLKLYDGASTELVFNDAGQATFMKVGNGSDVFFFIAKKGDRLSGVAGATLRPMRFITLSYGSPDGAKKFEIWYHTENPNGFITCLRDANNGNQPLNSLCK